MLASKSYKSTIPYAKVSELAPEEFMGKKKNQFEMTYWYPSTLVVLTPGCLGN